MIVESSFKPLWWMTNPHVQTIYSSLRHPVDSPVTKHEQVELPDGDFLSLAWAEANLSDDAPLVVILHGLGGCVNSSYVSRFMTAFNQQGWRTVLMHFRGAGEQMNRLPKAYHSGDTSDVDFLIQHLNQQQPSTKKAVVGVSLGGNVLLKWLGEKGKRANIEAAVAISVPYQLNKVANRMNIGFSRVYEMRLLNQFKSIYARKLEMISDPPEALKRAANCDCFWTFDAQVTVPLHGFRDVHAYYRECSSRQYLRHINKPTLLIHAKDDPFMTPDVLPNEDELSEHVLLELSEKGGHVGFVSAGYLGTPVYWLDQRIPEYLAQFLQLSPLKLTA
ncbi:MAG: hydrolase [Legionella sp.]|jgi:hypothetical protein